MRILRLGSIKWELQTLKLKSIIVLVVVIFTISHVFLLAPYPLLYLKSHDVIDGGTENHISENAAETTQCAKYSAKLNGVKQVDLDAYWKRVNDSVESGGSTYLNPGGWWMPGSCRARQKLAVIIPYRDRLTHLDLLLRHLHPMLHRQQRHYRIFVVEQAYDEIFNKGRIMNIAYKEAFDFDQWDCVIFHDVDLIPQNDRNLYECGDQPRHLSPGIDELRYTLMYWDLVGGILAMTPEQLRHVNGFSNDYWGWGAEDDDMYKRIEGAGYQITRPSIYVGRYKMIRHVKREKAGNRYHLLNRWNRWQNDGISSLNSLNYSIVQRTLYRLYTNITVDIGPQPTSPDVVEQHVVTFVDWLLYLFR